MATNPNVLFRGAATTTTTTALYTVPAATTTIVSNIAVTNTAGTAGTFTLSLGPVGSQTSIATTTAVPANTTIFIDLKQVLLTGQQIQGGASATSVSFHISGVEIS